MRSLGGPFSGVAWPPAWPLPGVAGESIPGNALVLLDLPAAERFVGYWKSQGRTERHRKNVRTYLAQWAEVLYGEDLR
jgi:hypothetical protein